MSATYREDYNVAKLFDWSGISMSVYVNDSVAGRIKLSLVSISTVEQSFATCLVLPEATSEDAADSVVAPSVEAGQAALEADVADMPEDCRQFLPQSPGADVDSIVSHSMPLLFRAYADAETGATVRDFGRRAADGPPEAYFRFWPLPASVAERSLGAVAFVE